MYYNNLVNLFHLIFFYLLNTLKVEKYLTILAKYSRKIKI